MSIQKHLDKLRAAPGRVFQHALVRPPSPNFARGLTTVELGTPDVALALTQHREYCSALERCGVRVVSLPVDADHPDSTFVEDTAVILEGGVVVTRPGAPSRQQETLAIRPHLPTHLGPLLDIEAPGTLDGGDVCITGRHVLIGLSHRTNEAGAEQLAAHARALGYTSATVDIREVPGILHLKSGLGEVGPERLVAWSVLAQHPAIRVFDVVTVPDGESYAANCLRVNDHVLLPHGSFKLRARLLERGYRVLTLDMTEFQKMDGGLTCLSLRW